ncbi:MAG: hypothetical protein KDD58_00335 [Bdellovibrionales bacterium]|nr:hypothetical protein [Bdellovibrionales bacterium]
MSALAQSTPSADLMNARSYLESLIVKKYSQQLSTRVIEGEFKVSASLQIAKVQPKEEDNKPIGDLDLTYINPEALYQSYSGEKEFIKNYWEDYAIKKVEITLGLKNNLGEELTKEVSEWFSKRVQDEFGKIGEAIIHTIKLPESKEIPPQKSIYESIKDLQSLVGLAVLALALILAAIIIKAMSGSAEKGQAAGINVSNKMEMQGDGAGGGIGSGEVASKNNGADEEGMVEKINRVKEQIIEIVPQLKNDLAYILKEWCLLGEQGIVQVACLAEAAGKVVNPLPLQEEFREDVARTFKSMRNMSTHERLEAYSQVYWDLLASLNLGSDTLHRPFSFVGGVKTSVLSEVLMQNSAKMNTIVTLYMSDSQRQRYLEEINESKKIELLNTAAELSDITEKELLKIENDLAPNFVTESEERMVSLDMTLTKLINSLTSVESLNILPKIQGNMMEEYKIKNPSLAFLHEWPDDYLRILFKGASTDEILNYLQIRSDMVTRVMAIVPPMTQAILKDDLAKETSLGEMERSVLLDSLLDKLRQLIGLGDINLETVFKNKLAATVPDINSSEDKIESDDSEKNVA